MKSVNYLFIPLMMLFFGSCREFLDAKPDESLAEPATLKDLQALLDDHSTFISDADEGEVSADDYYVSTANWLSLSSEQLRRVYIWEKDYLFETGSADWSRFGTAMFYCNTVLEGLTKIEKTAKNASGYDNIKGEALYYRGKTLLQASSIWMLAYDEHSSSSDPGLPLRLSTNFNDKSVRASSEETYQQILADIKASAALLPVVPVSYMRPSRPAAYACLARAFLSMRNYEMAGLYADSCLQLFHGLLNYNELKPSDAYPFKELNKEVISVSGISMGQILSPARERIVEDLYRSYDQYDLRRSLFFITNADNSHSFKGNYTGGISPFSGLATDEIYLIRAECYAREGKTDEAMQDLNTLMVTRWQTGKFVPFTASSGSAALQLILAERRKQLLFRGIRWTDIKRLNKEGAGITLRREVDGRQYELPPNDLRYALPLPEDVIALSGMQQNSR